jgi:hypothetical protein
MTFEKFNELLNCRIETTKQVLANKNAEYARNDDKLSNFKRAASLGQCTPERALIGMLTKHIISVYDMIDDLDQNKVGKIETWNEKIGDTINYMILLEALINERIGVPE